MPKVPPMNSRMNTPTNSPKRTLNRTTTTRTCLDPKTQEALHEWLRQHATDLRTGRMFITSCNIPLFNGQTVAKGTIYRHMRLLGIQTPNTARIDVADNPANLPWTMAANRMRDAGGPETTPEGIAHTISMIYGIPEAEIYDYLTASRIPPNDPDALESRLSALERMTDDMAIQLRMAMDTLKKLQPLLD